MTAMLSETSHGFTHFSYRDTDSKAPEGNITLCCDTGSSWLSGGWTQGLCALVLQEEVRNGKVSILWVNVASLNLIRHWIGSQWSWPMIWVDTMGYNIALG